MIDRIFTVTLTFALLLGATLAIGSDLLATAPAQQAQAIVQLPRVVVTGSITPTAVVAKAGESTGRFVQ